jgi:hypothetical protein
MADSDRLLSEARDVIATGNRFATVFFVGSVVWWTANLLPYDFAETGLGTPTARLSKLKILNESTDERCRKLQDRYASSYGCFAPLRLPGTYAISDADGQEPLSALIIANEVLAAFRRAGPEKSLSAIQTSIEETPNDVNSCDSHRLSEVTDALKACVASRDELIKFSEELSHQANLDVAGIKIANIHPRWHPAFLVLILATGAIWLGALRRKAFRLLKQHMEARRASLTTVTDESEKPPEPALLTLPWWLLPGPDWGDPAISSFRAELAPSTAYAWARVALLFVAMLLGAMFASAIEAQRLLSAFNLTDQQVALSNHHLRSFSLFGSMPIDLMLITGVFFASVVFLWWGIPPRSAPLGSRAVRFDRRELVRGGLASGTILFSVAAVPLAVARQSTISLANKVAWGLRLPLNPRYRRRKRKYAQHIGPPGWYRAPGNSNWVAHFVKPAYRFEHKTSSRVAGGTKSQKHPKPRQRRRTKSIIRWAGLFRPVNPNKKRKAKLVVYPAGRIASTWRMKAARLTRVPDDTLPARERSNTFPSPEQNPAHGMLNARFYSEGVETQSLQHWQAGDIEGALKILRTGLSYANGGRALNIRLYDLLAGLLIRSGRKTELMALRTELDREVERLSRRIDQLMKRLDELNRSEARERQLELILRRAKASPDQEHSVAKTPWPESRVEIARQTESIRWTNARLKHLQSRLERWANPDGKWANKWAAGAIRKWGSVDI